LLSYIAAYWLFYRDKDDYNEPRDHLKDAFDEDFDVEVIGYEHHITKHIIKHIIK